MSIYQMKGEERRDDRQRNDGAMAFERPEACVRHTFVQCLFSSRHRSISRLNSCQRERTWILKVK